MVTAKGTPVVALDGPRTTKLVAGPASTEKSGDVPVIDPCVAVSAVV